MSNITIENNIIGALIRKASLFDDISHIITVDDFSNHFAGQMFKTISEMIEAGQKVDIVTLDAEHTKRTGFDQLADIGELAKNSTGGKNIVHYANRLKEKSQEGKLLKAGQEIIELSGSMQTTSDKINEAQEKIMSLSVDRKTAGLVPAKELMKAHCEVMQERCEMEGTMTGMSTGFVELDDITSGLHDTDLIIVAGRPSMGKTTFSMNLAENILFDEKNKDKHVLVFSLEMSTTQLIDRSIASIGRIDHKRIRSAKLTEEEWNRYTPTAANLAGKNLLIDDTANLSVNAMRSAVRRASRRHNIGAIVVDYIQIMDKCGDEPLQAITKISAGLKSLAKETNCPVIALSQLNRRLEQRPNKRPILSDLRESGAIEQDADMIMFVYRDEVYNEDSPDKGIAEIIIGKQRNGEIGTKYLGARLDQCRFENFDGRRAEPEEFHYKRKGGFDYD